MLGGLLILDTNIVLDLFVFRDPQVEPVREAVTGGAMQWLANARMRDELERVLAYEHLVPRMAFHSISSAQVLAQFDARTRIVDAALKCPFNCKDPDDQHFVDLAVAHRAWLLSKDKAVLALRKRVQSLCGGPMIFQPAEFAAAMAEGRTAPASDEH
jgi:putative PIN family toxin of toxin-antitoxin system